MGHRLSVYISIVFLALLFFNGIRPVEETYADTLSSRTSVASMTSIDGEYLGRSVAQVYSGGASSAAAYLEESYTWFVNPAARQDGTHSRVSFSWMSGLRRALSSPVFTSSDAFSNYHKAESAARSFASWRSFFCGGSGGGAISVWRPGDSYVYALCRIVI